MSTTEPFACPIVRDAKGRRVQFESERPAYSSSLAGQAGCLWVIDEFANRDQRRQFRHLLDLDPENARKLAEQLLAYANGQELVHQMG